VDSAEPRIRALRGDFPPIPATVTPGGSARRGRRRRRRRRAAVELLFRPAEGVCLDVGAGREPRPREVGL